MYLYMSHINISPYAIRIATLSSIVRRGCTYRQHALDNLTRKPQPHRTYRKRQLQHLSPARLKDPVKRYGEQEECDEVQGFVGLLVGGNFVVCGGKAGKGCDYAEGEECA
jgi:hypothetical protein